MNSSNNLFLRMLLMPEARFLLDNYSGTSSFPTNQPSFAFPCAFFLQELFVPYLKTDWRRFGHGREANRECGRGFCFRILLYVLAPSRELTVEIAASELTQVADVYNYGIINSRARAISGLLLLSVSLLQGQNYKHYCTVALHKYLAAST